MLITHQELLKELVRIADDYGDDVPIGVVIRDYGLPHKCIKCNGSGIEVYEEVTPYPEGFPDSGFVAPTKETKTRECSLCHGFGWTSVEYKPVEKVIITGYEEAK